MIRIFLFFIAVIICIYLSYWPLYVDIPKEISSAWFILIGATNQFVQRRLESILKCEL